MLGSAASAMLIASAACGQSEQIFSFDLPAQSLKQSLKLVTRQVGVDLFAMSDDLTGREAPALKGSYTIRGALNALLSGSGLDAELNGRRVFIRPTPAAADAAAKADIVVTGSRIRGAPVASPVISLSEKSILESGKTTIGDAVRTIPQNFGGGQNPGIAGNGSQANNANFNSSSSINLRGLGPDATLTLINGHRVAYDANVQGIDIDAIPLAALDRIEIVPDGASALYGSDAVGGVANIILKKDYRGATVSARYGATTDGGGEQQQYTGVTGGRWSGGGVLAAFDLSRTSVIAARDRSYTANLSADQTIYPSIRHISGILAGHQQIGDIQFEMDAIYSHRTSFLETGFAPPASAAISGFAIRPRQTSYSVSPKIGLPLGAWQAYVTGTYGRDISRQSVAYTFNSVPLLTQAVGYANSIRSFEAGLEGPVARLLGQTIRAAIGAGYRSYGLSIGVDANGVHQTSIFSRQTAYYAFGELSVPLVSPSSGVSGIESLSTSAAVRYEDYPHIKQIATPKFGIIYKPVSEVTLKGSWGKSFKAPTLFQLHRPVNGTVYPATDFGANDLPAGANVLELDGGNPDLKPERATSWTVTAELAPKLTPGLKLQVSYFNTRYRDRVVDPISSAAGIFGAANYQYLIHYDPTLAYLDAIAATIPAGIVTESGEPYDPSTVAAVIDDRRHNAAKQTIRGIDATIDYRVDFGKDRSLTGSASASHLQTKQQLGPGQPLTLVSGQIFYMPKWNGHGSLSYATKRFSLTADITYIGGVLDERFAPTTRVGSTTPLDVTLIYHLRSQSRLLDRIDVTLTVQNLLNDKPSHIRTTAANDVTFDSTNYPATGRFVGATISKSF